MRHQSETGDARMKGDEGGLVYGVGADCQPDGVPPVEIHRLTVTSGKPPSACGKGLCFLWRTRLNPGKECSISKADLCSVAPVASKNRVIGNQGLVFLNCYGLNL